MKKKEKLKNIVFLDQTPVNAKIGKGLTNLTTIYNSLVPGEKDTYHQHGWILMTPPVGDPFLFPNIIADDCEYVEASFAGVQ